MSPDLSMQSMPMSSDPTVDAAALQRAAGALFQTLQRANEQHQRLQKMMQVAQPENAAEVAADANLAGSVAGLPGYHAALDAAQALEPEPAYIPEPQPRPQVHTRPAPPRYGAPSITPAPKPNMYSVDNWLTRRLEQFHEVERRIEAREQKVNRLHLALGQVVTEMQAQVKQSQESRNALQRLIEDGRKWAQTAGGAAQKQLEHAQQRFEQYMKVLADADQALSGRVNQLQQEAGALLDPLVAQLKLAAGALVEQQVSASQTEIEQRFGELETVLVTRLQEQLNVAQASVQEIDERAGQVRSHVEQTQQQADAVVQVMQDTAPLLQSHLDQLNKHRDESAAAIAEELSQARTRMDELAKQFQEQTVEQFEQVQDWLLQQGRQLRQQIDSLLKDAQESVPPLQDQVESLAKQRDEHRAAIADMLGDSRRQMDEVSQEVQDQATQRIEQVRQWLKEQGEQLREQAQGIVEPMRTQMDQEVQEVEQRARVAIQAVRDHAHRFATALDSSVARIELRTRNGHTTPEA